MCVYLLFWAEQEIEMGADGGNKHTLPEKCCKAFYFFMTNEF